MASAPSKTTTVKVINNKTGVTTSNSTTVQGNKTTVTKTTTIGQPKTVSKPPAATTAKAPATAAGTTLGAEWITGPNTDGWTMCGPAALANHLLIATGAVTTNAGMERLYRAAGGHGKSGAPLEAFLAAAKRTGLAGHRVARYRRTPAGGKPGVLLLSIPEVAGLHAAAVTPDGDVILWGSAVPLEALGDVITVDAWSLTWHGQEASRG